MSRRVADSATATILAESMSGDMTGPCVLFNNVMQPADNYIDSDTLRFITVVPSIDVLDRRVIAFMIQCS